MTKPKSQNRAQVALGFLLLAGILAAAYWATTAIWNALSGSPAIGAGIAAATLTGALAIVSTFVTKHLDRKATIVSQLREKKVPVYENVIQLVFGMFFSGKGGRKKLSEQEIIGQMADITEQLTIWGSDELVQEYHKFRMASLRQSAGKLQNQRESLIALVDLMLAIRKDLGHKNKNVSRRTILSLFINDLSDDID